MARARPTPLPTGTVTFLFTDIEGSTRIVQAMGDAYPALLERHADLIRTALRDHGGIEVSTEGDAFFAVFPSATDAVAAAVDAQRGLASAEWPPGIELRVRMGLHTGAGRLGGDDYAGLDVHRAARIAAAGHGGQILISATTKALTDGSLPAGTELRDLGRHRLKDLDELEQVYQISVGGLPAEFPRLRTLDIPTVLPSALSSFVGREDDIDAVWDLLCAARLVTLAGPGGIGKTRLAVEVARGHADTFADGVHFVALDALHDPALVPSAIAQVLGLREEGRTPEEELTGHLASKRLLLILDNFEQILPAAGLVGRLLHAAPALRVLVTSRIPLGIAGEQEYAVAPLGLPDTAAHPPLEVLERSEAIRLFVERAQAVRPGFALTPANGAAIAGICARLDGLPLALELAAARVKLLSPEGILGRLEDRLALLVSRSPELPARQRSLRGAIEWSWELLPAAEQRLFERLSIFSGGWDLAAAESVCHPDQLDLDVLDGMAALLDQSLILRSDEDEPRFTMLQSLQDFGREHLEGHGEASLLAGAHAAYFRDVARAAEPELVGADPATAIGRLARDQDNLRAALDWAISTGDATLGIELAYAIWRYWQGRGQLREGRGWVDRLLELPAARAASSLRARGLTAAGGIAYWQGDPAVRDYYAEALEIERGLGDERGIADALQNLAFSVMGDDRLDEGLALFRESLARYRSLGDERNIASVMGAMGYANLMAGRYAEAQAAIEEALAVNLARGARGRASDNRLALGHLHRLAGELEAAATDYRAALIDTRAMGDAARLVMQLEITSAWASAGGHHRAALRLAGAAERARQEHGGSLSFPLPGRTDPVAEARSSGALGEAEIAAALAEGRTLALPAAVDFAESVLAGGAGD